MSNIEQLKRQALAAKVTGWHYGEEELPIQPAPVFEVEGDTYTLADMLAVNVDDADFCEWARQAKPGDYYPAILPVRCVSGLGAALQAHTIRCPICHAHSAAGHVCGHGGRA